jgi:ATP synthase protein I
LAVAAEAIQDSIVPKPGRQPILSILLAQVLVSGITASVLAISHGSTVATSALAGGMIAVVPNAFLAARLLSATAGTSARALLGAAWIGEIGKFVMTVALFAAVFVFVRPISAAAVLGGYIVAQLVVFCAPLIAGGRLDGRDGKAEI